ncbi:MAG: HEAT repeat domain-containing protein [Candidatus Tectomicrobia bacterium]|nr:HEAT repeat domain-containing protein [Candidatus Tectomicrobia bacterium]
MRKFSRLGFLQVILTVALFGSPLGATNTSDREVIDMGPESQLSEAGIAITIPTLKATLSEPSIPVETRYLSALALGRTKNFEVIPALLGALEASEPRVRVGAVSGLAFVSSPIAVPDLRTVLLSDPDMEVKAAAMWALAEIGTDAAIAALAEAASDESQTEAIRVDSVLYIGRYPRDPCVGPVLARLLNSDSAEIRAGAAVAAAHARVGLRVIPHIAEAALNPAISEPLRRGAIQVLEDLTGEDFLYTKSTGGFAQGDERADALQQLAEWWDKERINH